ncbi:MAG: hypothetical protein J6Y10_00300 [Lachnospiraceae bacterium]|nr:hypothetical protein [Lachnospiraceae bacterium]
MSYETTLLFNKNNLDEYLHALAKEYKRVAGRNTPAEIVLVGGAAVLAGYGFRESTTDIDAFISAASAMKDAINRVRDRFQLPEGWINTDFRKTESYSDKLLLHSKYYKTYLQVLNVRIVTGEYLIAMKMRAFREYKNDISDIIGIIGEHAVRGEKLSFDQIDHAIRELYGSREGILPEAKELLKKALTFENFSAQYELVRRNELAAKKTLLDFQEHYPEALKKAGAREVLRTLREKRSQSNSEPTKE